MATSNTPQTQSYTMIQASRGPSRRWCHAVVLPGLGMLWQVWTQPAGAAQHPLLGFQHYANVQLGTNGILDDTVTGTGMFLTDKCTGENLVFLTASVLVYIILQYIKVVKDMPCYITSNWCSKLPRPMR